MKRKWYLIPAIMFLACIVFAVVVRCSYTKNVESEINTYNFNSQTDKDWKSILKDAGFQNNTDLIGKSDLILKAKFDGDRLVRDNAFYSTIHVQEVYKGDKSLKGQNLIVTESISVFQNTKFLNCCSMPMWIPLEKDSEYVMLLQKIPFVKERTQNDFQQKQYYPVTNSPAGCYLVEHGRKTDPLNPVDVKKTTMSSLKGKAFYSVNERQASEYYEMKKLVFQKLNLSPDA